MTAEPPDNTPFNSSSWILRLLRWRHGQTPPGLFLFIDPWQDKNALAGYGKLAVLFQSAEETGAVSFMTCGAADLINLEDHRVLIAIDKDFFDDLCIAGLLAFFPEFVSGTGTSRWQHRS